MKNILLNKSKAVAACVTVFLTMSSLCYSQLVLEAREKKAENPSQKLESIYSSYESKQFNNSDDYFALNSDVAQDDTIIGTPEEKIIKHNSDPANKYEQITSIDSTRYNMFGDLLNDDTLYNKKYPIWIPLVEVPGFNVLLWSINRYVSNADFARIGPNTWSHNLKTGWEWDMDRFGMNFLAHPYSGGLNFTSARANGYNFWESVPFAIGGSLMWEYFGENTLPSYNDIINTPISGAAYGEILYRLSSNLLDDRTTGLERFLRELGAAAISPTRFFNRLVQGKLTRVTRGEVYQKEPLNIELAAGRRNANNGNGFGSGPPNLNIFGQLDYGYPFEIREWKPYDFFTARAGMNFGVGRKIIENITGYGILFGKNVKSGDLEMLIGAFQHYNYFDNKTFELGAIALGGGIMSKYPFSKESYLFTNFHLGIVPLAGNSTRFGPETSEFRDYNYGGGLETKLESGINLDWASIQFIGYYFWINTWVGATGNNYIGIIRPRVTVRIYRNINIGFEQMVYYGDLYTAGSGNFHSVRSEQRIYLMLNVGNFKL
jgi:hypothetical protein